MDSSVRDSNGEMWRELIDGVGNYLKEIEEAYRSSKESYSPHTVSPGTAMEC